MAFTEKNRRVQSPLPVTAPPRGGRPLEGTATCSRMQAAPTALGTPAPFSEWQRGSGKESAPTARPALALSTSRLGSQLNIPASGCSELGMARGSPRPPASRSCSLLSLCSSLQRLLPAGTGCLTLVRPSADPAPHSFINRPISHLALAQSSTPKRQMQPQDFLSSQGQSRTRQQARGPEG